MLSDHSPFFSNKQRFIDYLKGMCQFVCSIWRIQKYDIERPFSVFPEKRRGLGLYYRGATEKPKFLHKGFDDPDAGRVVLHKHHMACATAKSFDPHCACACIKIQKTTFLDLSSQDVEYCVPDLGRSPSQFIAITFGDKSLPGADLSSFCGAAGDSHYL